MGNSGCEDGTRFGVQGDHGLGVHGVVRLNPPTVDVLRWMVAHLGGFIGIRRGEYHISGEFAGQEGGGILGDAYIMLDHGPALPILKIVLWREGSHITAVDIVLGALGIGGAAIASGHRLLADVPRTVQKRREHLVGRTVIGAFHDPR